MGDKKKTEDLIQKLKNKMNFLVKYKKAFIVLLIGVLLLISANIYSGIVNVNKNKVIVDNPDATRNPESVTEGNNMISPEEYALYLQTQIENLLSTIEGVGKVKALVYVDTSCEVIPAYNSEKSDSSLDEIDSEGGKRNQEEHTDKENLPSNQDALVLKVLYPKIKGICISAQGAGSNVIKEKVKNALMALYGIEAYRIEILSMKG